MTRALLGWLGELKGPLTLRFALALAVLAVVPLTAVLDATGVLLAVLGAQRRLGASTTKCPAGHEVELYGGWTCRCGMVIEGSAWARCPACGDTASFIQCACGRTIMNPLSGRREW